MRELIRLIDANANRATEAARTLEDLARFCLDDGPLAASCKRLRHGLESTLTSAGVARGERVRARDTSLDAGVINSAADPHTRTGLSQIALAAGSRLAEALRAIEEALKASSPPAAAAVERLRYDAYEIERRLERRLRVPPPRWTVCVLITESLCSHHAWQDVARLALRGGADCLQLREKSMSDRELLRRAAELVTIARDAGASAVINDRPDIARLSGADGVHLGQEDLTVAHARRVGGDEAIIGVSCTSVEQANQAAAEGADLVGLGAMFPTTTKDAPIVRGPKLLEQVLAHADLCGLPHLAIGGIDADRAVELAAMGCRGVAVSRVVCGSPDPETAVARLVDAMTTQHEGIGAHP